MARISKLTGIILAGGKSTRMGKDKGMALLNGKPLVAYAIETLKAICDNIIISANSSDYKQFGYPVQADLFPNCGPIGGIYSGLMCSKTDRNLVLSCDIPLVSKELLTYIIDHSDKNKICVPVHDKEYLEPLCACYPKTSIALLKKLIKQQKYKLNGFLNVASAERVLIHPGLPFYHPYLFFNLNQNHQLEEAKVLLNKYKNYR